MSYLVNSFRYMSIYFLPFAKCKKKKKNATFYNISMHLMLLIKILDASLLLRTSTIMRSLKSWSCFRCSLCARCVWFDRVALLARCSKFKNVSSLWCRLEGWGCWIGSDCACSVFEFGGCVLPRWFKSYTCVLDFGVQGNTPYWKYCSLANSL